MTKITPSQISLKKLNDDTISSILDFLTTANELSRVGCANKFLRVRANRDDFWQSLSKRNFNLSHAVLPKGELKGTGEDLRWTPISASSFREAWFAWRKIQFSLSPTNVDKPLLPLLAPFYLRALRIWDLLKKVLLDNNYTQITETLCAGANGNDWYKFCESNGFDPFLPELQALRMLHSIHDGQELLHTPFSGIPGGYNYYNQVTVVQLLSLEKMTHISAHLSEDFFDALPDYQGDHLKRLIIASDHRHKHFFLDHKNGGNLYVGNSFAFPKYFIQDDDSDLTQHFQENAAVLAAPERTEEHDAVLLWLEVYVARLIAGFYKFGNIMPEEDESAGIILFPRLEETPMCLTPLFPTDETLSEAMDKIEPDEGATVAVTKGVQCEASSIFLAESKGWTYSIRLKLIDDSEMKSREDDSGAFTGCQLQRRHWEIRDCAGQTSHVSGRGVVGKYPFLYVGGFLDFQQQMSGQIGGGRACTGDFVYQSQTGPAAFHRYGSESMTAGSFGGELEFQFCHYGKRDGRTCFYKTEENRTFNVVVKPFKLVLPKFVY
eukprot:g5734.t1